MFKDYYQILRVNHNAKNRDIKKAYRRLALKFHPDRNPEKTDAEEKFKIILEAYQTLCDQESRRHYDREYTIRLQSNRQPPPEKPLVKPSQPRPRRRPTARDKSVPVEYSWSDSIMGRFYDYLSRKKTRGHRPPRGVKLVRTQCIDCDGSGLRYFIFRCPRCAGEGHYGEVYDSVYKACPACRGNGYGEIFFSEHLCDYCDGVGIVKPKSPKFPCHHCNGYGWTLTDSWWRKIFSLPFSGYFMWRKEECYWCNGIGMSNIIVADETKQCPKCRGWGRLGRDFLRKKRICPKCEGRGGIFDTDE